MTAMPEWLEWDTVECYGCGADLVLLGKADRVHCSDECLKSTPLSSETVDTFTRIINSGLYHVDAFLVADAILEGPVRPPKRPSNYNYWTHVPDALRSYRWRKYRLAILNAVVDLFEQKSD